MGALRAADLGVTPIVRATVHERVYEELRELLMRGRFAPGQPLTIGELADVFGTSAQPVRDAIRQLVAEKALEALPNRSVRVRVLDAERLEDIRLVRRTIEGLAAELAAKRATEDDIAHLSDIVAREKEADDEVRAEASVRQNRDFHFFLYRLSSSTTLPPIIESLWLQIGPYIRQAAEIFDAREGRGAEYHFEALAALKRGDSAGVRRSIEGDIDRFFALLAGPEFASSLKRWSGDA